MRSCIGRGSLAALCLTGLLLVGSMRPVHKYVHPGDLVSLIMLALGAVFYFQVLRVVRSWVRTDNPLLGLDRVAIGSVLALTAAVSYVIYPIANALRGGTADDAMILAAWSFVSSGSMYAYTLPGGVPISPGPGWVLLNLPFENSATYWLLNPAYMAIMALVCAKVFETARQAALCVLLVATSPLFWELIVQGHDIVALSFAMASISLLTYHLTRGPETRIGPCLAVGALAGLVATSRIIFAPFPALLALVSWRRERRAAIIIGGVGTLTAVALHLGFFLTSAYYQPAHLFGRGSTNLGAGLMLLGTLAEVVSLAYAYWSASRGFAWWLSGVSAALLAPLSFIAFGELRSSGFDFATWEGANYIFPCVPLAVLSVSTAVLEPRHERSASVAPPTGLQRTVVR